MRRLRTRLGAEVVPMLSTLRYLVANRGRGQILSLVSDQAAGPTTARTGPTSCTGRPASTPVPTAWRPIRRRGALRQHPADKAGLLHRHVYGAARQTRQLLTLTPEATQYPIAASFVQLLEADIRAAPEQYLWTHRRWKHVRVMTNE
ncbi:MAG: hypothetical protein WKG07_00520 [Hymenobacter sp.]